jgi:hypothetical protein
MVALNTKEEEAQEPEHVLAWCRNLVRIMTDGGTWGIPRSGIVFQVDKKNKQLVMTVGEPDNEDFIATKRVFKQIGWGVITLAEQRARQ